MITKEFYDKLKKSEIKKIENTLRQIAEEKPYLIAEFKGNRFYVGVGSKTSDFSL